MKMAQLESVVANEVDQAVQRARSIGINIPPGHFHIYGEVLELAKRANAKKPLRKGVRVSISESKDGQIEVGVYPGDEGAGFGALLGGKVTFAPIPVETPILPSEYTRKRFRTLFLPHLDLPREVKSQIAKAFYSAGLGGLVSAIERHLSGTERIKAHLLIVITVMDHRDDDFAHQIPLFQDSKLLRSALILLPEYTKRLYHH